MEREARENMYVAISLKNPSHLISKHTFTKLHFRELYGIIHMLTVRQYTVPVLVCRFANGYSVFTVKLAGALLSCSSLYVSPSSSSRMKVFPRMHEDKSKGA